jgi:hypothetical protein
MGSGPLGAYGILKGYIFDDASARRHAQAALSCPRGGQDCVGARVLWRSGRRMLQLRVRAPGRQVPLRRANAVVQPRAAVRRTRVLLSQRRGLRTAAVRGANEGCCEGVCTPGLLCASGTCLDPDGVMDSAPCGLDGSPCCGHYEDCDEDLLCVSKRCARA